MSAVSGKGGVPTRKGDNLVNILGFVSFLLIAASMYMGLVFAPEEAVQGPAQRIFYVHLPQAVGSYIAFFLVFLGSIFYLWKGDVKWDVLARSSAEVGVLLTSLVLITGSIWAKPIWNTWWTWEPRLTFTLVLWMIYVAYLMLRWASEGKQGARYAAVLGIVGFFDVPIIFLSVFLWSKGLHPRPAGMDPGMLAALIVSIFAFLLLFTYILIQRWRWETSKEMVEEMKLKLGR
ncbi:MAG: cytochrome c biogenesis protein CcsA [Chloroflexi bacterium]|nr:cytochrome c biogenesis protein CcsA [Chloroflexota bacterium]